MTIFGPSHTASSVIVGGDHVGLSPWIFFGPLFVIFLMVYIIVHEIRSRRMCMPYPPYPMPPMPPQRCQALRFCLTSFVLRSIVILNVFK